MKGKKKDKTLGAQIAGQEKRQTEFKYELKDSTRAYWYVSVKLRGAGEPDESGYYETNWTVKVKTEAGAPEYSIKFVSQTQYDEPLCLDQIAREIHEHIMRFYDVALSHRDPRQETVKA